MNRRLLCVPIVSVGAALLAASPSFADTATDAQASGNWSGYVAGGSQFSKVSGSWVQPEAKCDSASGDAAFWVGIGGASGGGGGVGQAGPGGGRPGRGAHHPARDEVVPAAP